MSEWQEWKVAKLREMWAAGRTVAQIAPAVAMTKNAVIGKAHRLGLPGRPSPIIRERGQARAPRPVHRFPKARTIEPHGAVKLAPVRELSKRVRHVGTCCWTDSNRAPWVFCDEPAIDGGSWCESHRERVFQRKTAETA